MLQHLDNVPWAELEHAYGSASDVPDLLRKLLDPDPKVRSEVLWTLYGNVFHQGTRYPATPLDHERQIRAPGGRPIRIVNTGADPIGELFGSS